MKTRKRLSCTVSCNVPKGMSAAHFRRLIRDQVYDGIWLSIADQIEANTNVGKIRPTVSAARREA